MVKEALRERSNFLSIAPHLTKALPILLPLYDWWKIPYMWIGIKMYDLVSGDTILRNSYYLNTERSLDVFPQLNETDLKGGIVYFDGQQNDARMCVALALTAARMGANVANYVEVTSLVKEMEGTGPAPPKEVVKGAVVKDTLTGKEWTIRAKCVINATGPFTDAVRRMDDSTVRGICQPSAGVHITLPGYFTPKKLGLLNAETSDGRVVFVLPWQGVTLAGTTDKKCKVSTSPVPSEEDIEFILNECRKLIKLKITRNDVLSAWSGIRPLVLDPSKSDRDTKKIARNHIIEVSDGNLITIAGGKWTTYRSMAEETVDAAIKVAKLRPPWRHSQTIGFKLEGAHDFEPNLAISLENNFGVDRDVAKHLACQYGDKAIDVLKLAEPTGKTWPLLGTRLVERYPYIEAEIRYAIWEYAVNAVDVIARRTRLAFQDVDAAKAALPRIVEMMGAELKWDAAEKTRQTTMTLDFLDKQMGYAAVRSPTSASSMQNTGNYLKKFLEAAGGAGKSTNLAVVRKSLQSLEMGDMVEDELEKIAEKTGSWHANKEVNAVEFLNMVRHIVREKEIMDDIHSYKVAMTKSNTQYMLDQNLPKSPATDPPKPAVTDISKPGATNIPKPPATDLPKPPATTSAKPKQDPKTKI
ncbi:hypothetical protein RvY_13789-1 [Ramazzottius varieornatus]|uniref:glycerol-3-phosphate dehydrogenase n=1 Tax=Ramazzottius varieornatus TaxID=947166 RepID=A0A1D1VP27_RAMVA|nr:hypothetical protein RvY_13789-1 [Ramazzottius varieornatus]